MALIFEFLRPYQYIRNGALSSLADDEVMAGYVADWKTLVSEWYRDARFDNRLIENYCGGVYLANEALVKLRDDYPSDSHVRSRIDETFSHGRLAIFWRAADMAISTGLGLVEASELVEPSPLDLNSSRSFSNLFNCHPDGAGLYAEAASAQLAEAMKENEEKTSERKRGLFARIFRK